jgi:hypothetical protein
MVQSARVASAWRLRIAATAQLQYQPARTSPGSAILCRAAHCGPGVERPVAAQRRRAEGAARGLDHDPPWSATNRHTKVRHGRPGVDGPERPRPGQAHHPGHRRADPGRSRQHGRRAHRRADEQDPVGAASAQLLGRRDHVAFDPRSRSGSRPGVAEPFEVEGERLVAPVGERPGAGKPFAQVPAATVGEDQAGRAVADHDPDQDCAGRGAEPERPGRPDVAQARLGEAGRGGWRC